MKKLLAPIFAAALLAGFALAQTSAQPSASVPQPATKIQFAAGTIIRIQLVKSIDAKKAKVGDEVLYKTTDDFLSEKNEVLAPSGSKVSAHVAEVTPRLGDSASTLGIAFDKLVLKDGSEVALKAVIQAIGRPESASPVGNGSSGGYGSTGGMSPMPSSGRGGYGGRAPTAGGASTNTGNKGAASEEPPSEEAINGRLTPNARGVVGISGVSLSAGSAQDSLLTSQKHNVKLDSGTQIILRVTE